MAETRFGRPLKGKSRRVPITVHSSVGMLDDIDEYVEERSRQEAGAYSRSDFFNEAALVYLQQLGRNPEEEEVRRNRSVTEKSAEPGDRDNNDNSDKRSEEK